MLPTLFRPDFGDIPGLIFVLTLPQTEFSVLPLLLVLGDLLESLLVRRLAVLPFLLRGLDGTAAARASACAFTSSAAIVNSN